MAHPDHRHASIEATILSLGAPTRIAVIVPALGALWLAVLWALG